MAFAERRREAVPLVLQMEAVECGAAALAMVLAYHGLRVPLADLRRECGVSRDGSKASNIVKAARRYGLVADGRKREFETLWDVQLPAIVFWHFNHFVVLEGYDRRRDRVYLADPAVGPRTVSYQEFDQGFTGVLLTFEKGPDFVPSPLAPPSWAPVTRRLAGAGPALAFAAVAGALLVLPNLAVPVFSKIFIDQVLVAGLSDWLRPLLVGMAVAALMMATTKWLQLRMLERLRASLAVTLSGAFIWHALRLPQDFYAQRYAGEIAGRADLNRQVAGQLAGPLATAVIDLATMVIYGAVMLTFDTALSAVVLGVALAEGLAMRGVLAGREPAVMRLAVAEGKTAGVAIAGLQSIETLKASGLEDDFFARWAGHYTKALNARQEMGARDLWVSALPTFTTAVSQMGILVVGGWRVMDGLTSIGTVIAFQALAFAFLAPLSRMAGLASQLQTLRADLARLDDVLDAPTDPSAETPAAPAPVALLSGMVELRDVTFGYSRSAPPLIQNLSVTIRPGRRVAFVGSSGSGKSTLVKLIAGLYQPWSGEILLDGVPRHLVPRDVLTASVALVDQDVFLFEGTARANLTLWDDNVPEREMVAACQDALAHDAVMGLPGGYGGRLNEGGSNLSGGQRQRLEIARALTVGAPILLLDEATSALDAETERLVDERIRKRGCTCVLVAHRLSTIRDADEILVLDGGRVVQRGTHDALIAIPGVYRRLILAEGEALTEQVPT